MGSAVLIDTKAACFNSCLFFDFLLCPLRCHKNVCIGRKMVSLADATNHTRIKELSCSRSPHPNLHGCHWIVTTVMVTLITEQLRKQSLEEPYDKALNVNVVSRPLWPTLIVVECLFLHSVSLFFFFAPCLAFSFSLCLQWVPVPLCRGAPADQHQARSAADTDTRT